MKIKSGDIVRIKDNLRSTLEDISFDKQSIDRICKLIGEECEVLDTWTDTDLHMDFITVDLCLEIPTQCVELV